MDLGQLQKEKQDLEQQLAEKNKVRVLCTSTVYLPALSRYSCLKPFGPFLESFADAPGHVSGEISPLCQRPSSWISTCAAFLSRLPPREIVSSVRARAVVSSDVHGHLCCHQWVLLDQSAYLSLPFHGRESPSVACLQVVLRG